MGRKSKRVFFERFLGFDRDNSLLRELYVGVVGCR